MNQIFNLKILTLIGLTVLWCFLHSALISNYVVSNLKRNLNSKYRYFRITYNLFSSLSFIVIIIYESNIREEIIFHWNGYLKIIQLVLFALAILLFYLGSKQYSFSQFIGFSQLKQQHSNLTISETGDFNIIGIHKITRHPWYLGTLIIIWLRDLSISIIYMNLIFTAYLIIGSFLEERKLINEFGQSYLEYKKEVSMLIPFKWIITFKKLKTYK